MIKDLLPELKKNALNRESLIENDPTINRESLNENALSLDDEMDEEMDEGDVEVQFKPKNTRKSLAQLLKKYATISEQFKEMEAHLAQMQSMVLAVNAKDFDQKEFDKLRRDSIQINNNIAKKFKKLESKLPGEEEFSTLARMKRLLYHGFFQQYVILWSKNEKFLLEHEVNMKKKLKIQSQILNCNLTDEDLETMIENKNTDLFTANILQDAEAERKTLQELKDRFKDLKNLEKSIAEVHNLFINLQTLVAEQGEIMQSIETHFDAARNYVEEAKINIGIAEKLKRERCCKCCGIFTCMKWCCF